MKTVFIYGLVDPRTDEVRYIGKTSSLKKRLRAHIEDRQSNADKARWIADLAAVGATPEICVLEVSDERNWAAREMFWIGHGAAMGWKLLNKTAGGEPGGKQTYNLSFLRDMLPPDVWERFSSLDYRSRIDICVKAAQSAVPYLKGSIGLYVEDRDEWKQYNDKAVSAILETFSNLC